MKKIILSICTILVLLIMSTAACFAEIEPGGTGTATFSVISNPDAAVGATVSLSYDSSAFDYVRFTSTSQDEYSIADLSGTGFPDVTANFQVKSTVPDGTYYINVTVVKAGDIDGNSVTTLTFTNYAVIVKGTSEPTTEDPTPSDPEPTAEDCKHEKTTEKVTKQATCEEAGEKQFVCDKCGEVVKTETIPALGHKWDAGKETAKATCEQEGVKTYTCQNDAAHTKTEAIPALGHDYKWTVVKPATTSAAMSRMNARFP